MDILLTPIRNDASFYSLIMQYGGFASQRQSGLVDVLAARGHSPHAG
jgi:hypothetical protein